MTGFEISITVDKGIKSLVSSFGNSFVCRKLNFFSSIFLEFPSSLD